MKRISLLVTGLVSLSLADPILPTVLNEFQAAPDSLQWVELSVEPEIYIYTVYVDSIKTHSGMWELGWEVSKGEYRIFEFPPGTINRDADTIKVYWQGDGVDCDRGVCSTDCPPEGASLSRVWYTGVSGMREWQWYVDPTPTFGDPNDDWGMITGRVLDETGKPIPDEDNPRVAASGELETDTAYSSLFSSPYPPGSYLLVLAAGKYELSAWADGYESQAYPDSVAVGSDGIDFKLRRQGIKEMEEGSAPFDLLLANPAGRATQVRFKIPEVSSIRIVIYDGVGRLIRTLFSGEAAPGEYRLFWDGCDRAGKRVPPGSYFITLDTGRSAITKKLVMME